MQKRGEEPNQSNLPWGPLLLPAAKARGSTAAGSGATSAGGFAAQPLDPDVPTSRLNPEEGGKLLRLPALPGAEVSKNRVGYRKQMACGRKSGQSSGSRAPNFACEIGADRFGRVAISVGEIPVFTGGDR